MIEYDEHRFVYDDLDLLTSNGLLLRKLSGSHKEFYVTRAAVELISELKK